MDSLFLTKRLSVRNAKFTDIYRVMEMETDKDNRKFIWQGTYEEHINEIESETDLLLVFEDIGDNSFIGYSLICLTPKSEVFELRRIAIDKKGLGYGQEVMQGLLKFCFDTLKMNRFWLDVYPDNGVGIALYKKLGFIHEGTLRQSYKSDRGYLDQMIFSILKEDYK